MDYRCKRCGGKLYLLFSGSMRLVTDDRYGASGISEIDKALEINVHCFKCFAKNCETGYIVEGGIEDWAHGWQPSECTEVSES